MDATEISKELIKLHIAQNDKTGTQNSSPIVMIRSADKRYVSLHMYDKDYKAAGLFHGETPAELFALAYHAIRNMPSAAEQRLAEFQKKLANIIDYGRENNIDVNFVNPLIAAAKDLAENAITHVKDTE
jgi:hypothetical protein